MKGSWKRAFLMGLACLAFWQPAVAGSDEPAGRSREREVRGGFPVRVYSGGVVVRVEDESYVTIAVDEADSQGAIDGFADHVFSLAVLQPIFEPLSLRDASADVEFRPESVRVLLHTEERELEFVLEGAAPRPRPQRSFYRIQTFPAGARFYEYSGPVVERFSLDEVQQQGMEAVQDLHPKIGPYYPPVNPDGGGGACVASCSKTCGTGSCTASCVSGHCAKCKCIDVTPNCYCV